MTGQSGPWLRRASGLVRVLSWAAPVVAAAWLRIAHWSSAHVPRGLLVGVLALLFACLVSRVVLAGIAAPARRVALAALAIGLIFWAAGSAVLNAAAPPEAVRFPAPGEWLFFAGYAGFSAFLVLDRAGTTDAGPGRWLDAVIVMGGTACVALMLLVTPLTGQLGGGDVPILVALLYPLLDVTLMLLVVGQVALRQRPATIGSAALGTGCVVLAVADASLVASVASGAYQYGELLDLLWCLGFLLVVESACSPTGDRMPARHPQQAPRPGTAPIVAAAAIALITLLIQQDAAAQLLLDIPAVLTLIAVGLRLILALRQSRQLNEALRLSRTDDLTGLPNRRALTQRLEAEAHRRGPLALMLLDLDGFKEINDSIGHSAGDAVLAAISRRVAVAIRDPNLAVRLGGDEFALLLHDDDSLRLMDQALRLRDTIRKPVRVDGLEICLEVSVGISVRGTDGAVNDLLRQADVAMYQAKKGRLGVLLYDGGQDDFSRERLQIAEELRRGIAAGEVVVWYQPKVDALTSAPHGVEALVRWQHPTDGLLPPGAFLPAARRTGLMPDLTRAVFARVLEDMTTWQQAGYPVQVAVNIAPAELLDPAVIQDIFTMLRGARIDTGSLIVEVTEDSFIAEPDRARRVIEAVRREGLEVSIDDFGTGFSSLGYLRDLPVQELKIDRSFVADLLSNPRDHMIVKATNELGKGLGLRTVAEGVEDPQTALRLQLLGVDVLQGYHFARPMPFLDVLAWHAQHSPTPHHAADAQPSPVNSPPA